MRWTVRTAAVNNYSVLITIITEITEESHDECGRNFGPSRKICYVFSLCLAYMIFSPAKQLSIIQFDFNSQACNSVIQF